MLSFRAGIATNDPKLAHAWRGPLVATGAVAEQIVALAPLSPETRFLIVDHALSGFTPAALQTLPTHLAVAATIPVPDLELTIEQLRSPAVSSVVVRDYLDERLLSAIAVKAVRGDVFGLSKVVAWGVQVHTEVISSYDDRTRAMNALTAFAQAVHIRAKHHEALCRVAEELLMNALYDAPIDGQGNHAVAQIAPDERHKIRLERPVVLQMAAEGSRVVLAVRDSFGSLRRETVVNALERCARGAAPLERETAGAGLGLFMVAKEVTELVFNVAPGVSTEVVCVVDFRQERGQLMHLGYHAEVASHVDATRFEGVSDKPLVSPASLPRAQRTPAPRFVVVALVLTALLLAFSSLVLLWPSISTPPSGQLVVSTEPEGATVYLNGVRKGTASSSLALHLEADRPYAITAKLAGYRDATETVSAHADVTTPVRLTLTPRAAALALMSAPPGAAITINGKESGETTPVIIRGLDPVPAYQVTLQRYGYVPFHDTIDLEAGRMVQYRAALGLAPGFAMVRLESKPSGAKLLVNHVETGLKTPVDSHVLRAGQDYDLELTLAKHVPWRLSWHAADGKRLKTSVTLARGEPVSITSNVPGAWIVIGGERQRLPVEKAVLALGHHAIRVRNRIPFLDHTFKLAVRPDKGKHHKHLRFGFAKIKQVNWRFKLHDRPVGRHVALSPGTQTVELVDARGHSRPVKLTISAGQTQLVDLRQLPGPDVPQGASMKEKKEIGGSSKSTALTHQGPSTST